MNKPKCKSELEMELAIWLMDGTANSSVGISGAADLSQQVEVVTDFDGDGKADILWQHGSGMVAVWLVSGMTRSCVGNPGFADPSRGIIT